MKTKNPIAITIAPYLDKDMYAVKHCYITKTKRNVLKWDTKVLKFGTKDYAHTVMWDYMEVEGDDLPYAENLRKGQIIDEEMKTFLTKWHGEKRFNELLNDVV